MPTLEANPARVRDVAPRLMLLARRNGNLIGYVAARESTTGLEIDDVQVHPDHQRLGVATALMARVVKQANRRNHVRVWLETKGTHCEVAPFAIGTDAGIRGWTGLLAPPETYLRLHGAAFGDRDDGGGLLGSSMKLQSRPRAVLFDLFNTLVPGGTRDERDGVSRQMAKMLGVAPDALAARIRDTFDDRTRGRLGGLDDTVRWLARSLGAAPSDSAVAAAVDLRIAMTRSLHEQTWAVSALKDLGAAGVLRGLVSDCSAETPNIWPVSPLSPHMESVSFSCVTGHRKPEPEAYLAAVRALRVDSAECLFVGDGGSYELTGAEAMGMSAIRFQPSADTCGDSIDEDTSWSGEVITDLRELLLLT